MFFTFLVELPNGVEVWWDGFTRVYIDVPSKLQGKTMVNPELAMFLIFFCKQ